MHIAPRSHSLRARQGTRAFNIVEAVFAMAISGIMFVALYSGISSSFFNVRLARENLRATQILVEKMEVIRLLTWDQINSNGFLLTNFSAALSPRVGSPAFFNGSIDIQPVLGPALGPASPPVNGGKLDANYSGDLRIVTVTISWKTGGLQRSRRLSTYISRFGIQNYVFN